MNELVGLVDGLMNKGFNREQAVFLSRCIAAGRESSKLRDEIGTFGLDKLDAALANIIATPKKDLTYNR
jgi:hypothetical protein